MPKITETYTKRADTPEKGNKVHYDDTIKGFGLRVTKAGAKSFVLNYSINRRERRMTIGSYPAWTAAAAREEAKRLRRVIDQGEDPLEERNQRKVAPNVSDLWSEYERVHLPTLSDRSQTDQRSMWSRC
jgi:Arm domain-containing DNA-binding protein